MGTLPENPVINSPYEEPRFHWQLDPDGQPTSDKAHGRRRSFYLMPIPKARRARKIQQGEFDLDEGQGHEETSNDNANRIREQVGKWRKLPKDKWGVTDATARLLEYWRAGGVGLRPFFCQIEAAETLVWLTEVAPRTNAGREILKDLAEGNEEANKDLLRYAAKMATGSGKTTVMAMMMAYHAINKSRSPASRVFCENFLLITPGITIKDRLRVLLPQDPENYYERRGIVPREMLGDVRKARIVITNYQALARRELSKATPKAREKLKGNDANAPITKETEGQMLKRVCPQLLEAREVVVINDEAHHCYRHKDAGGEDDDDEKMTAEEKAEVKKHDEAARLWISGIYALQNSKVKVRAIYDLSATPFFLRGSGYREGSLFPWVVSDFPLMEAIECGIVKIPRVPTEDATVAGKKTGKGDNLPVYRNLYRRIVGELPRRGRSKKYMDPNNLPAQLQGALQALYSNYEETSEEWAKKMDIPPVFIVICNNTATSKLVYDHISGYRNQNGAHVKGKFALFSNIGGDGKPLPRPRTLLIDSYQLESGEAMDKEFKKAAAEEIEQFKSDIRKRGGARDPDKITDEDLLREVMNTVGKEGKLGEQIRCVVSVSMLTEGWDTSNVTHILGVRAFGTQLLCEQVVGRGLRRVSYETNDDGMLSPQYAEIFGVPFAFAAKGKGPIEPPEKRVRVRHLDERDHLAITFPRVRGYKYKPPEKRLTANFDKETSRVVIKAEDAPPKALIEGIVGEGVTMTLDDLKKHRKNEVVYHLAAYTARTFYKEKTGHVPPSRFQDLAPIVREWMDGYLECRDGTFFQYLLWTPLARKAADAVYRACVETENEKILLPVPDPYTPEGGTQYVDYMTSQKRLHNTTRSHINIAVCDSSWEEDFCKILEADEGVRSYARNAGLEFVVPYQMNDRERSYYPDFIVLVDDGEDDLLRLVVEIKGFIRGDSVVKADTMRQLWVPAVNNHGGCGRWAFEEIRDPQDAAKKLAKYTSGARAAETP